MLTIQSTTVKTTATEVIGNIQYFLNYDTSGGELIHVICQVAKVEEGNPPVGLGVIKLQNGKIFTEILEGDVTPYIEQFQAHIKEIRDGLKE